MSDFGSGLEQCGPRHEMSGRASKADLRRRIANLEAENGRMDDALHSAFDDYRVDFPGSSITDYDDWITVHVTCGNVMWAP